LSCCSICWATWAGSFPLFWNRSIFSETNFLNQPPSRAPKNTTARHDGLTLARTNRLNMYFRKDCGASKGSGGGSCPEHLIGGTHSFVEGNQEMACRHCNKRVGGRGSVCKESISRRHEFA
jgi:hypothetical protein